MRRTLWYRVVAVLTAFWFPMIIGAPAWLPPCPMHGAGMSAMMQHGASAGEGSMSMSMSMSMDHGATAAPSQAGVSQRAPAQHNAPQQCTCIDCCGIGVAAVLPPTQPLVAVLVAEVSTVPILRNVASLPRPAPAFSRPYTTGPPRA